MQKGIGRAMHMAPDPKFLGRYAAIAENKMWCGDSQAPRDKVNGTNPQCLTKGFGIGAKINAERNLGRGGRRPAMGFGTQPRFGIMVALQPKSRAFGSCLGENAGRSRFRSDLLRELESDLVEALAILQKKKLM